VARLGTKLMSKLPPPWDQQGELVMLENGMLIYECDLPVDGTQNDDGRGSPTPAVTNPKPQLRVSVSPAE
jgi:hypothetical protein